MKKTFLWIVLMLLYASRVFAVPAFPELISFQQPNSKITFDIYLKGDEKVHWAETTDGYSLLHGNDGTLYYAMPDGKGGMKPSSFMATSVGERNAEVIEFLSQTPKYLHFSKEQVRTMQSVWDDLSQMRVQPKSMQNVLGEKKFLVILFAFADQAFTHTKAEFEALVRILASSIGSPVNPTSLANTFKSVKKLNNITDKTIETYIGYLENAFMIEKAERYEIKGKKYIGSTPKYYFKDLGLRNAILSFRQTEENHLMENSIFNEMHHRGFLVDVGNVNIRVKNENNEWHRVTLEVDFVCNLGSRRYYLQSAYRLPDEEKTKQEKRSLMQIGDSFKKMIIVGERLKLRRDDYGIVMIGIHDFLLDPNLIDV